LQSQQVATGANTGTNMDGLMASLQQQMQKQVDQMYQNLQNMIQENMVNASNNQAGGFQELKGYMEQESGRQQGRHQDISSVVNNVLEQSCGAKTSAEECASNLARLRTITMASMDQIGTIASNRGGATTPRGGNTTPPRVMTQDKMHSYFTDVDGSTQCMSDSGSDPSRPRNNDGARTPPRQHYDSERPSGLSQTSRRPSDDPRGPKQTSRYGNVQA